ncbi:MAG: sigma-70 family RNA polymerase sigma factor [Sedimentisphaerales bacterium]|nr:sigma-70 family RNA polymerase sigma factor [Sedimentisphaerales bacterium]
MAESEYILLRRFTRNSDAEAFAQIIKQHAPMVYGVCLRILTNRERAADVVQDTFIQLVRDAAEITGSLPNWLHTVAVHRSIDLVRRDSQRKQREFIYASNPQHKDSEDNKVEWQEISGVIDEELDQLEDLAREVLILHFFENKTMTEIAEKFEISQPTVSRKIESGIDSLRQRLKSRGVIVPAAILTALLTENIVQAAPASIMKELGKIALSGGKVATGVKVAVGVSVIKTKIIAVTVVTIIVSSAAWYYNSNGQENHPDFQQTNAAFSSGLFLDQNSLNANLATIVVTDQLGNTLSNVSVTEQETYTEYITDENGQFTCKVSDEIIVFYAIDKQHKLVNSDRLYPGQRYLQIRLEPSRFVSGQVIDNNGKPVPDTKLCPLPMTCWCILSDEEGRFDIGWLPKWEPPSSGLCLMARNVERNLAALADISKQAESIEIELTPALTLTGTVTNPDGTPFEGAELAFVLTKWDWGCGTPINSAVTDNQGRFVFHTLPQLQKYGLNVRAEGYIAKDISTGVINTIKETEEIETIVLYKKQDTSKDIEYSQLLINVTDEDNKPVDITEIKILKKDERFFSESDSLIVSSTEKPGFHKIEKIETGYYPAILIDESGYIPYKQYDIIIEKGSTNTINCILSRGGIIEGVVVNEQEQPIEDIPVVINSPLFESEDVVTDENGRFYVEYLPDMRYSVVAEPESESPYETTVFRGDVTCGQKDLKIIIQKKKETKRKTSLVGEKLPQLDGRKIDLDENKIKNKNLLICFFDFEQRLSRSSLIELSKKALELKIRNIIVAAVHVSDVEDDMLNRWLKENDITFQVGKFQGRDETLFNWGITALPHLVLTDKNHIVTDEGFPLTELDEKIKSLGER